MKNQPVERLLDPRTVARSAVTRALRHALVGGAAPLSATARAQGKTPVRAVLTESFTAAGKAGGKLVEKRQGGFTTVARAAGKIS